MRGQGGKVAAAEATKRPSGVVLGGRRERKLGALAGKIRVASDFDETPAKVVEAFEGK